MWLLNGTTILNQGSLTSVAPPWQIQGLADFNGDGKADVLWRNPVTGQNWLWLMNGMTIVSSNALPTVPDPNWSIGALGDIDGDGLADVVWKNTTTGNHWLWRMNGSQIVSQTGLNAVEPNWQIELGGDLNADGKMDLVLRNTQSKQVWVWLMNDAVIQDQGPLASAPDATWILANGVDLNADGKRDLVWRQGTNSAVTGTLIGGLTGQGGTILSPGPGADWRIVPEANRTGGQGKSLQKADAQSDRVMRILPPTKAENGPPQHAPAPGLGQTLPRSARETADFRLAMTPAREAPGMPWFEKGKGPNTGKVAKAGQWVTEVYHVHPDHLGTPRAITRPSDNQLVWKWDNTEPFGNNAANENPSGLGIFPYNLRHPGQYADQEMGTFYNYFRDYDPATGRYRQSDPIGLLGGVSTYGYVLGNPLKWTDRKGLDVEVETNCSFPTVICKDGKPKICVPDNSDTCGIAKCLELHERQHLEDMIRENDNACVDVKEGGYALIDRSKKVRYEIIALIRERECLEKAQRVASLSCKRACTKRIGVVDAFMEGCKKGIGTCKSPE